MKRILVVLVVIILALLIVGAVLWKAFGHVGSPGTTVTFPTNPTAATPVDVSPEQYATAFYTWYLANYATAQTADVISARLSAWLTPSFASQVPVIESPQGEEVDAFFLSQDAPPQNSTINTSVLSQTDSASNVRVVLQSSLGSAVYLVHLMKMNGQWRIDSVSSGS